MLDIQETKSSPKILFDSESKKLMIHGRSVLKNMDDDIYRPVFDFLDDCKQKGEKGITTEFFLDYFNTSSHPSLIEIFKKTADITDSNIVWLFEQNDLEMMEIGSELSRYSPKPIEVKQIEE